MMKFLNNLHKKYDRLVEPLRLYVLLMLSVPAIIVIAVTESFPVTLMMMAYFLFLIGTRLYYLGSKNG